MDRTFNKGLIISMGLIVILLIGNAWLGYRNTRRTEPGCGVGGPYPRGAGRLGGSRFHDEGRPDWGARLYSHRSKPVSSIRTTLPRPPLTRRSNELSC